MTSHLKLTLLFALISPGLWQVALHLPQAVEEWRHLPTTALANVLSKPHAPYLTYIPELRWGGRALHRNDPISRLTYSKGLFLLNESFDYLQYLTPRLYFAAGDGTPFSPSRLEPIAFPLFFFWLIGLIQLIKHKRFVLLGLMLLTPLPAFLTGHKNLSLLLPTLVTYIYLSAVGWQAAKKPRLTLPLALYGFYLITMNLWLNY